MGVFGAASIDNSAIHRTRQSETLLYFERARVRTERVLPV